MEITATSEGTVWVVKLIGNLDTPAAAQTAGFFEHHLKDGHARLVVDLSALTYLCSAGLRALLNAAKEARRQNGDLRLAAIQAEEVSRVLKMSGFDNILKVHPDVAAANASFAAAA